MRTALSIAVGMALALAAPAAFAQDTTAGGTAEGTLPPPKVVTKTVEAAKVEPAKKVEEDEVSDHEKVVGHIGVGYLGLTSLPLAGGQGIPTSVSAPIIGVRYWLAEKIGLDLGVGFGLTSGSTEVVNGAVDTTTDAPSVLGVAVHGGVPLVFAHQKHYKFLLVPELNVGFAHATFSPTVQMGQPAQPDTTHSGFLLDVGARVGAEIHFGFIGIPSLALQATVGAFVRRETTKTSTDVNGGTQSQSTGATKFGTSVQSDPWALFANNISAIYYLP
jgi:hypothetical protein